MPILLAGGRPPFPIAVALAALVAAPAAAADYAWPVTYIVDSGAVAVDASADMPPELAKVLVRLRSVDTPEAYRAQCQAEYEAGLAATAFTMMAIVRAETIVVRDPSWGERGGNVIADLMLDGRSLSSRLVEAGHGRPNGGGKDEGWCD